MNGRSIGRLLTGGLLVLAVISGAAGCGDDDDADDTPSPTRSSTSADPSPTTPQPTATASPEDEVLNGYANYWAVYTAAVRDRDSSHLGEVMTGPRLERARQEISDLQRQERAIAFAVDSNPVVLQIAGDQALVFDEYENKSYYIDPTTKQPVGPTPSSPETIKDTVTMRREGGIWKVFDGVREESGQ